MFMFCEPSKVAEPETSPLTWIVRAVCKALAVLALPITPAVTAANVTDEEVPTAWPISMVGVAFSPELLVSVTPVPATRFCTKLPTVSSPRFIGSFIHAVPFQRRTSPFAALVMTTSPRASRLAFSMVP